MSRGVLVLNICNYIDDNITDDIKISDISNRFHFDRYYLMKVFKKETGITIVDYINKRRIQNSMPPLASTDDKILKIALNSGFNSLEYYSEEFTKIVGISPSSFRKLASNYDITPYLGGSNMTLTQIQTNIESLKELRNEVLKYGEIPQKENSKELQKESPKVKTLLPRQEIKKAA